MNGNPNYFKIGLFVIIAACLTVAAIVVFGSGLFTEEKVYFETYFDSSVTGLSVGAPVLNRGVRIGQVEEITFVRNEYELPKEDAGFSRYELYVMVVASVDQDNLPALTEEQRESHMASLIEGGFRIRLASNLLTGQGYLEGTFLEPERFPTLEILWQPKFLYVPSAPGEFATIKNSIDDILHKLDKIDTEKIGLLIEDILVSVDKAIDDANVPGVSKGLQRLLATADRTVEDANVPGLSNEIKGLFADARVSNQHLEKLLASKKSDSETADIPQIVTQLNTTLKRIDRLVSGQTPQIDQVLENLRKVSENLEELTENLKKYPSQAIFSKPPPKSEVLQ